MSGTVDPLTLQSLKINFVLTQDTMKQITMRLRYLQNSSKDCAQPVGNKETTKTNSSPNSNVQPAENKVIQRRGVI